MITDDNTREGFSLRRWSARKHAAARERQPEETPATIAQSPSAPPAPVAADATAPGETLPADAPAPLPPVESLTFESDFAPFMQPTVDERLKRAALRKLFRDPRFNVMDGLDVYIDDYSKPDPLEPDIVKQLAHARYIFDPPKTRVNDQGYVEDVPEPEEKEKLDPVAADEAAAAEEHKAALEVSTPDPVQQELPLGGSVAPDRLES